MNTFSAVFSLLVLFSVFGLLVFVYLWFTKKRYPQKTGKMLDALPKLETIGLKRDANGFSGVYRAYPVYVYATTSMNTGYWGGNKYQVWVITAPQPGDLKGIGGFFGKYLVAGERPGYAMVGFLTHYSSTGTPAEDIHVQLDQLIDVLLQQEIKAYPVS